MPTTRTIHLHELLTPDTIRVGLRPRDKEGMLNELVDLLEGHPAVEDLEQVRQAVFDREKVMSTGVGKGIGLPHAKTPAVNSTLAAFAIAEEPVGFDALDGEPVRLFFLLVGTEEARSQHIKILSRVSRLLNQESFREQLLDAQTVEEVLACFKKGGAQVGERTSA